jgi:hypothetical protein
MSYDAKKGTEARNAVLDRAAELAPGASATMLLQIAEAVAWATYPNQPHGISASTGK